MIHTEPQQQKLINWLTKELHSEHGLLTTMITAHITSSTHPRIYIFYGLMCHWPIRQQQKMSVKWR